MSELDRHLGVDAFRRLALPYEAGFVAGRAFVEYRRRGAPGPRRCPTSTSALMPPFRASACSRVTLADIQVIFQKSG